MNFRTRPLLSRMLHMLMEDDNDETYENGTAVLMISGEEEMS